MSAEAEVERSNPELVARIIEKATANIPADLLLRQTLARRKRLKPEDSAWICGAVFAYYRWLNWLPAEAPAGVRIEAALALARRFQENPDSIPTEELRQHAVPAWIHQQLEATPAWLRALQMEPVLWLRARTSLVADFANILGDCEPSGLAGLETAFRYRGTVDLFRHDLFQAGGFEIQDLASQAVGHVCAPKAGETWWDACAGEGGKTLHLSDLMDGKGLIWATDKSAYRLKRLKMRAGRAGCFNYRSGYWNGSAKLPTKTLFDGVLVDAPCTGVGTWGRNPHARWTTSETDVAELSAIQRQLLGNASAAVKPDGRLIYAVCTLTRAETTEVADAFTREHPEFQPLPLLNPFAPGKVPREQLTLWPQDAGGNGMFIAAWRRRIDPPARPEPATEAVENVPVAGEG